MVERFYPPSHIVFNKIDDLVRVTETLPGKFDNVVSKIPACFSPVSILDWTLVRAISLLNFVVATLSYWRMSKGTKEKAIKVDTNSKVERNNEPGFVHQADRLKEPLTPSNNNIYNNNKCARGDQIDKGNIMSPRHVGVTYKEVLLQKATSKAGVEKKEEKNINNKEEVESSIADEDDESETNSNDDGLLELFESACLMTSPGRNASRNYTPRSVSFTYKQNYSKKIHRSLFHE